MSDFHHDPMRLSVKIHKNQGVCDYVVDHEWTKGFKSDC
jgi:hypothetical protein